ncbi:biopolymer transporter ExbD [Verrucomicrobiaceae bacterium N1E253]|uniref:Biopolymer transporter ExbD n=1 Tax=Oceaniferula marina TaxID=2748318 RepID=A0A851GRQ1_9BACT|nr:biopolymer transporter ExbD [Oceaniferula marina]NWK56894.1 biopolymer transporter ExbD [Oceaniferula marina]
MKLEMTLPSKPGFLHVLPGVDLLALVLMFPLLGSSFVRQAGMEVTVHESPWRYDQMDNPVVITLGAGEQTPMWVNKKQVEMDQLEREIKRVLQAEGGKSITTAVVRSDVGVPSGVEKEVIIRIQKMGLNCGLVGRPAGK